MECLAQILDQKYPQFNTISPQHPVSDALSQMCCENTEYLIVLEEDQFVGIITEHGITKSLLGEKPFSQLTVGEVMNRNLPVANSTDSVEYAMQLMDRYNSRYLAIYDGFNFMGVVSGNDLLKSAVSTHQLLEHAGGKAYPWI